MKAKTVILFLFLITTPPPAHATDLAGSIASAKHLIQQLVTLINIIAGFVGAWFVFEGFLTWKKSSDSHANHVEFKSIAVPILVGVILLGFSSFVLMTSETFGLSISSVPAGF